jgi:hypothetical protein
MMQPSFSGLSGDDDGTSVAGVFQAPTQMMRYSFGYIL